MKYLITVLFVLAFCFGGGVAGKLSKPDLPVGTWKVEFANGVAQVCTIGDDGVALVEEPLRRSLGNAEAVEDAVVITFHDDRVERWTAVGGRYVVEHWFPGTRVPTVDPVLGIAVKIR